jgi:hypothetical protein
MEAGFFVGPVLCCTFCELNLQPGIMCYLCFWYKVSSAAMLEAIQAEPQPNERGVRMALFSASVAVSG